MKVMIKAIIRFFKKLFGKIETVEVDIKRPKIASADRHIEHGHNLMMAKRRALNRTHNQMAIQSKRFNRIK